MNRALAICLALLLPAAVSVSVAATTTAAPRPLSSTASATSTQAVPPITDRLRPAPPAKNQARPSAQCRDQVHNLTGQGRGCHTTDGLVKLQLASGQTVYSHGPDSAADLGFNGTLGGTPRAPVCATTNLHGNYAFHAILAIPSDKTTTVTPANVRTLINTANGAFYDAAVESGSATGGDIPFDCDGTSTVIVDTVNLGITSSNANFSTLVSDLQSKGYTQNNRKYVVYYTENLPGNPNVAGQGSLYTDETRGTSNYNNGIAASYSFSYGYLEPGTLMHEMGHNLGAVQYNGPHSTGTGLHCWEGFDVMCYNDFGDRDRGTISFVCPDHDRFDCNHDDYFDAAIGVGEGGLAGSYLDENWNLGGCYNRFVMVHDCTDYAPPTGQLTKPASSSAVYPGHTVNITGTFNDNLAVRSVDFYVVEQNEPTWQYVATDDHVGNGTYSVPWTVDYPSDKTLYFSAVVHDATGHDFIAEENTGTNSIKVLAQDASYHPTTPARLVDTRSNLGVPGPVGANSTVTLTLPTNRVPAGAVAVALNVTVTQPHNSGYLTVFPFGTTAPTASNLNFSGGQTIPNLVIAKIGSGNKVSFRNGAAGTVQLIADLAGYFTSDTTGSSYHPKPPARLMDTRSNTGVAGPVGANSTVTLTLPTNKVPAGSTAVALNVTATQPKSSGYITVFPFGAAAPTASNLNFVTGKTIPNLVIVQIGSGNKVSFKNGGSNTVQLIADLAGYFTGDTTGSAYHPAKPVRLMDTRQGFGAIAAQGIVNLILPASQVPAGTAAVTLNVTATQPTAGGYLTVYPFGSAVPTASNLNFSAAQTIPNLVMVQVGPGNKVSFKNGSSGSVHLIADLAGAYSD